MYWQTTVHSHQPEIIFKKCEAGIIFNKVYWDQQKNYLVSDHNANKDTESFTNAILTLTLIQI